MIAVDVVDVLRRFAAKQATEDEAMRALAEHDGWFAPALLVPGEQAFERLIVLGTEGRTPTRLWLFTDEQRVHAANGRGFAMGIYGGRLRGTRVFELLDERFPEIDVNPGSPLEETWHMGSATQPAFRLARMWAAAITLERAFSGDAVELTHELAAYPDFMLLVASDNTAVKLPLGDDNAVFALAFTTPDWRDGFLAQLDASQRANIRSVSVRGTALFAQLDQLGVQGVILNIAAPERATTVISRELAALVGKT